VPCLLADWQQPHPPILHKDDTVAAHIDDLPKGRCGAVISPFLTGCIRRTYAAIFSFIAGVMPPMPMFGRSLLYVQSHCVA
jgi:hypothetical protein